MCYDIDRRRDEQFQIQIYMGPTLEGFGSNVIITSVESINKGLLNKGLINILSAMYADWGPPHLSLVVCYIFHPLIPQNLILQGLQQKWQKSHSRCNKNTWHVESSYMLQPPKYLLLFVNRFRYINNNVTKDRCSIPMDTTVRLGPLKFSLRATINHHGPSIHSGHYTASINCCKKNSISMITQLRSLELLTAETPLLHMLYYMNWLTHDFWTRTGGWEFDRSHGSGTSSPSHWQQVEDQAPKSVGWMMCFLLMTFVSVQKLCVNIYIYIYICSSLWVLFSLVYQLCFVLLW